MVSLLSSCDSNLRNLNFVEYISYLIRMLVGYLWRLLLLGTLGLRDTLVWLDCCRRGRLFVGVGNYKWFLVYVTSYVYMYILRTRMSHHLMSC